MAEGALQRSGATWAAAITHAGPGGGHSRKAGVQVWLALAHQSGTQRAAARYRGDRGQCGRRSDFVRAADAG